MFKNPFDDEEVRGMSQEEEELLKLMRINVDLGPIPKEMMN